MKKILKIFSFVLIGAFFSVILTGCGKSSTSNSSSKEIVVWSFEDEDVWKTIARNFASSNKDYTINYQKQTFDANYENRVLNSMLSGKGPDVWAMPNDWVYRHKDKLAPMPSELTKTYKVKDKFVESMQESVIFDDKLYSLAPSIEPLSLYYNPKLLSSRQSELTDNNKDKDQVKTINALFNTIPKTWTDFTELTKLITKKDSAGNITLSGVAMGTSKVSYSQDILYLLMLQNDTQILSTDMQLARFNLPISSELNTDIPGKSAMDFYTSFANPSSPNYSWNNNLGSEIDAFANGKVAFIVGYTSLQKTLLEKYPQTQYKRAYMPQLSSDKDKIVDYAKFSAFGVNKLSNNINASWKLITSLVDNSSGDYSSSTRTYTSIKSTNTEIKFEDRDGTNPDKLELLTAHSLVKGRYPDEFDSFIRSAITAVNNKTQNSQTAIDWAAGKATELLRKETW